MKRYWSSKTFDVTSTCSKLKKKNCHIENYTSQGIHFYPYRDSLAREFTFGILFNWIGRPMRESSTTTAGNSLINTDGCHLSSMSSEFALLDYRLVPKSPAMSRALYPWYACSYIQLLYTWRLHELWKEALMNFIHWTILYWLCYIRTPTVTNLIFLLGSIAFFFSFFASYC